MNEKKNIVLKGREWIVLDAWNPYNAWDDVLYFYHQYSHPINEEWNRFGFLEFNGYTFNVENRIGLGLIGTKGDGKLILTKDPRYVFRWKNLKGEKSDENHIIVDLNADQNADNYNNQN